MAKRVITKKKRATRPQDVQQVRLCEGKTEEPFRLEYLQYLPPGYSEDASETFPLILFLHGAGERGKDIWKITKHGPPGIVAREPDFPFIVISPQCPKAARWNGQSLLALLDQVSAELRVDPKRIYVTGISMGGYATWELITKAPQRFAAAAPICGGGATIDLFLQDDPAKFRAWKRIPIWAFHGAKDDLVPCKESERMVCVFKDRIGNPNTRFSVYEDLAHNCWTRAYSESDLFDWFLKHKLRR